MALSVFACVCARLHRLCMYHFCVLLYGTYKARLQHTNEVREVGLKFFLFCVCFCLNYAKLLYTLTTSQPYTPLARHGLVVFSLWRWGFRLPSLCTHLLKRYPSTFPAITSKAWNSKKTKAILLSLLFSICTWRRKKSNGLNTLECRERMSKWERRAKLKNGKREQSKKSHTEGRIMI